MSMTEEQVHEKVAKLFDDNELTIRSSRVVVPANHLDHFVQDKKDQMIVILNMKASRLQIPSQVARGVRESLRTADEKSRDKMCAKYDLTNDCKYVNLAAICKFGGRQVGLSEVFSRFMELRTPSIRTRDEFKSMVMYFFRYMPFVTMDKYSNIGEGDFEEMMAAQVETIYNKLEMISVDYDK